MLRVVLADDEKKVLLLMCKLIDWESLGFEIVGMASDGMHALEMIRDKQPVSYTHLGSVVNRPATMPSTTTAVVITSLRLS